MLNRRFKLFTSNSIKDYSFNKTDSNLSVFIFDNYEIYLHEIMNYLSQNKNIRVIGTAKNIDEALKLLNIEQPDLIFMNISSFGMDKLKLFKDLQSYNYFKRHVILLYENDSDAKQADRLGFENILIQPITFDMINNKIKIFIERDNNKSLENRLNEKLLSLGLSTEIEGNKYLLQAILLMIENSNSISNISKKIYSSIADQYQTTPSKVKNNIRYVIRLWCLNGGIEKINRILGFKIYSSIKLPTNGEFIALFSIFLKSLL